MSHALTCHLPAAVVAVLVAIIGIRTAFPDTALTLSQTVALCAGVVVASFLVVGAFHV